LKEKAMEEKARHIVELIDRLMEAKFDKRNPHIGLATMRFYEHEEGQAKNLLEQVLRDALERETRDSAPAGDLEGLR
jgi:hypothetical protein